MRTVGMALIATVVLFAGARLAWNSPARVWASPMPSPTGPSEERAATAGPRSFGPVKASPRRVEVRRDAGNLGASTERLEQPVHAPRGSAPRSGESDEASGGIRDEAVPGPTLSLFGGGSPGYGFDTVGEATSGSNPPDTQIAVGPEVSGALGRIVVAVNKGIQIYDDQGNASAYIPFVGGSGALLTSDGSLDAFDPRLLWDPYHQRFVLIALYTHLPSSTSWIYLAVSTTDDPGDPWDVYTLPNPTLYHADFPSLGVDRGGIHIGANLFRYDQNLGTAPEMLLYRTVDKVALFDPVNPQLSFVDWLEPTGQNGHWAPRAVTLHGLGPAEETVGTYISAYRGDNRTALRVVKIRNPTSAATVQFTGFDLKVPVYSDPFVDAPQANCLSGAPGQTLDVSSGQLLNAEGLRGDFVTGHTIDWPDFPNGNRNVARWYRIRLGPQYAPVTWAQLVESGEIDLGAGRHSYLPALSMDQNGSIGALVTVSSATEHAGLWATGKALCDEPGVMGPVFLLRAGVNCHVADCRNEGGPPFCFGDYHDMARDPTDGQTLWTAGEFGNLLWKTHVHTISVDPACEPCTCPLGGGGQTPGEPVQQLGDR